VASLERLVIQLRQKKQEATKLKKKAEKQLKENRSIERRSSSGLNSIDRKIESEREDVSDTSDILTRKTSQLESIERLVAAAEERLTREKEAIEQTEQEIEFSENPEEKQNAEVKLRSLNDRVQELITEINKAQLEVNKVESGHTSMFVAGWRPFVGWTCGIALCYHFVLQPFLVFLCYSFGYQVELPVFDMQTLTTILMGMLGLGTLRSYEKVKKSA
jgi:hypothetical protein